MVDTHFTGDGLTIEPQDLSNISPDSNDSDRMFHHNGNSLISLVGGGTDSTRGYYIWDDASSAWFPLFQNADKIDGKDAGAFLWRDGSLPMGGDLDLGTNSLIDISEAQGNTGGIHLNTNNVEVHSHNSGSDFHFIDSNSLLLLDAREGGDVHVPNGILYEQSNRVATRTWVNTNADVSNADYADNADQLDGNNASAFYQVSGDQLEGTLSLGGNNVEDGLDVVWDATAEEVPQVSLGGPAASLSAYPLANADLSNTSVTVAGNTISLGGSSTLAHGDLSDSPASAHHTRYADSEALAAINNDLDHGSTASHNYFPGGHADLTGVSSADHHAKYTDSEALAAVNNDADHGSTAAHNYFPGGHADLSGISSNDHHAKYTDSEALTAVNNDLDHGSTASHNYFAGGHSDLSGISSNDHHAKYTNEEAQDSVATALDGDFTYDDANNIISLAATLGVNISGDADTLDGEHATAFADSGHTHDARYYTESEADTNFAASGHLHDGRYIQDTGEVTDTLDAQQGILVTRGSTGLTANNSIEGVGTDDYIGIDTTSGATGGVLLGYYNAPEVRVGNGNLSDFNWNGDTVATQPWVNANADVPNADYADSAGNAETIDGYDVVKNGTDGTGTINFKT